MDEPPAEELLRRALIEPEASAAVALRVAGLPLCETVTVVFHGRRDLGTIQTYVANGGRGAGSAVAADELMRVPCDLDLGAAEIEGQAQHRIARKIDLDPLARCRLGNDEWQGLVRKGGDLDGGVHEPHAERVSGGLRGGMSALERL